MTALLVDAAIILSYFFVIVFIGMRLGRRDASLHEFALGGRRVPWWAVMASIIAAETSAATFLGTPGEGFDKLSLTYVQLVIGVVLGRLVVAWLFIGPYYKYKVYTVYDYLGIRFGPWSKSFVSALFLFFRTLASGARLFIPSLVIVLAFKLFTGGAGDGSGTVKFEIITDVWPYFFAIAALMIATCLYTAVGGIKAVIWTDVIQAALMFTSACIAILTLMYHLSGDTWNFAVGIDTLLKYAPKLGTVEGYVTTGFEGAPPSATAWDYFKILLANQYTLPAAIIGASFGNMAAFGTDQDMVQRLLTSSTAAKARRSLMTAAFMDFPIAAVFTFIGVLLFAYYSIHPQHLPVDAAGVPSSKDVFGSYILNVMPVGIRGIVLAGVFATAMGSLSAALNALATSATNDWYLKYRPASTPHQQISVARISTVVFAVLMVGVATGFAFLTITDPKIRLIPLVLGIGNFILGPMLGVFLLGMLTKRRGSDLGNVIAVVFGLAATFVLGGFHVDLLNLLANMLGNDPSYKLPANWPKVAFTWYALVGATIVFAIGVLFPTPLEAQRRTIEAGKESAEEVGADRPVAQRAD
jgi:solute:Na+ symporter, SSS family